MIRRSGGTGEPVFGADVDADQFSLGPDGQAGGPAHQDRDLAGGAPVNETTTRSLVSQGPAIPWPLGRCGVHRRARFGHQHLGQAQRRVLLDEVGGEPVGLPGRGPVADRDQIGLVLLGELGQDGE